MRNVLLGAIIGDMCGKPYEFMRSRVENLNDFDLITPESQFTDDTVCTIAIADALIKSNAKFPNFKESLITWCRRYPGAGYGKMFYKWFMSAELDRPEIYSYGNGSGMRVSSCGWSIYREKTLELAKLSTLPTHSHPEGIKGAQAIADCIWTANNNSSSDAKSEVLKVALDYYPEFDFNTPISELRKDYTFDCTCQGSVPQAIKCYLESNSYEDCIRKAIWLGGDTDTIAAMAGSIAFADYWFIPEYLVNAAKNNLPTEIMEVVESFDDFVTYEEW